MKIEHREIINYLPHRYPFVLIDRVIACEPGKSILALKNVTCNEDFFNGHFPAQAVMPGVLVVEALAQAAGMLYFITTNTRSDANNWFYLAGINKARFKRVVIPGDQLHLEVEMLQRKRNVWFFTAQAKVDNELACAADLLIAKGALK